jgi:hypothetical protein
LSTFLGDFGLYRADNHDVPYWITTSAIQRNAVVAAGTNVYSPNRAFLLAMQEDSNLVIYEATSTGQAINARWASSLGGGNAGPYTAHMQVRISAYQ